MIRNTHYVSLVIMICLTATVQLAYLPVAGNVDPFDDQIQASSSANENDPPDSKHLADQPSIDIVQDIRQTPAIELNVEENGDGGAGPSFDIIDFHPHRDPSDDNASIVDNAKRQLIQPSLDFLDAQIRSGDENHRGGPTDLNQDIPAANLDDYQRWLKEQNDTNQLQRFLSLQKEVNQFHLDRDKLLSEKLNRTIEELKHTSKEKRRFRFDL